MTDISAIKRGVIFAETLGITQSTPGAATPGTSGNTGHSSDTTAAQSINSRSTAVA